MNVVTEESPTTERPLVHRNLRPDGVCILTLDASEKSTLASQLGVDLDSALNVAMHDDRVRAVVLCSGRITSFLAGVNVEGVRSMRFASDAEEASRVMSQRLAKLTRAKKPIVACVRGAVHGEGFELALACTATVSASDDGTTFSLPEVKLGLLPCGNGLLRVAQRAGLRNAIDLGLSGRSLKPKDALSLGLVDEVTAPDQIIDAACRFALRLVARPELRRSLPQRRAWMRHRGKPIAQLRDVAPRVLLEKNPLGRAVLFRRARMDASKKTRGHYPATDRMLDLLAKFGNRGFHSAAKLEARLFGELAVSETSHRLVELFLAHSGCRNEPGVEPDEVDRAVERPVERIAVLGAGVVGAGVACVSVQAGLTICLKDNEPTSVERGLKYVQDVLAERVRRGSVSARERDVWLSQVTPSTGAADIASADLVFEAVFEDLAQKQTVIREVESLVKDSCVIASSTLALQITHIAEGAAHPERIVGMHYFRPVHRMPLLEVVRTKHTDPSAVATAVSVGRRQGKTVIVVRDGTGFYTTRILAPFLSEATQMLTEGVSVDAIDHALEDWGFPKGPLHLLDEIGIDVAAYVAAAMETAFGSRLRVPGALAALRADDRKGRKNGRGFYLHGRGHEADKRVDDTVYHALRIQPFTRPMPDEVSLRCAVLLVNEALRCLDEGILRSPRDGDVGAVDGLGFPAFRGGPFRYVDVLGAPEVLRRTRSLEQRFGERFEPAPLLVEMARKGKRFYS